MVLDGELAIGSDEPPEASAGRGRALDLLPGAQLNEPTSRRPGVQQLADARQFLLREALDIAGELGVELRLLPGQVLAQPADARADSLEARLARQVKKDDGVGSLDARGERPVVGPVDDSALL